MYQWISWLDRDEMSGGSLIKMSRQSFLGGRQRLQVAQLKIKQQILGRAKQAKLSRYSFRLLYNVIWNV